ncbi:CDGSH iron-sulfur domain-containing protein [Streptomyces roseolus]|uniref:CDGSH iron-sulfur domain-containing protein n=1 Tax=Streptomyces roseolus TaxID=67358 RepID=UPI0037AB7338
MSASPNENGLPEPYREDGGAVLRASGRAPTDPPRLRPLPEGPLLVEGPVEIVMPDGRVIRCERPVMALCTCRRTLRAPFCDTSHRHRARRPARRSAEKKTEREKEPDRPEAAETTEAAAKPEGAGGAESRERAEGTERAEAAESTEPGKRTRVAERTERAQVAESTEPEKRARVAERTERARVAERTERAGAAEEAGTS